MKNVFLLSALATILLSNSDCGKKKEDSVYKGRLEIKAICANYTVSVIEGNIDTSRVVANWTDENTGKSYKNAFKLDQVCHFPKNINQGDEFYFTIDTSTTEPCIVCLAYYPVPPRALAVKVVEK